MPNRSWSHWAGRPEHDGSPWVEDERLAELRDWLLDRVVQLRSSVRVTGRAGVGKSRLVNEALCPAEDGCTTGWMPSDLVLYAVESEVGQQALFSSVQSISDAGTRAIVVVDHCVAETHGVLAAMVSRRSSRLSLITIGDHISDGSPDQSTFEIGRASDALIEAIINRVAPRLPMEDHRRLARFAGGFPEVALRVGQTWSGTTSLTHATDETLVDAYVLGREPCDRVLLLKVAELLAAFGAVRTRPLQDDELPAVASLASGLTESDVRSAVNELVRRSAVKRRGGLVIVQPLPIALRLAERRWSAWSSNEWDLVLTGGVGRVLQERAARQLAFLNTSSVSEDVLRHVCRLGGPFDGAAGIATAGHAQVVSSLAEVDPETVGMLIQNSLSIVSDLHQVTGDVRRHLVWALEKIAFHPNSFEIGAHLLLRLAAAENESCGNNASGQFAALFPAVLGNTAADGETRLAFLDEVANFGNLRLQILVVDALVSGCQTAGFSRMAGPESHGSRPALEPWFPPSKEAAKAYITGCLERLARFAAQRSKVGDKALAQLGSHLRSLITSDLLEQVEEVTDLVLTSVEVWPEAVESLGRFLAHDAKTADSATVDRVRSLMAKLQPTSVESRARFLVTEMPWDYLMDVEHDFDATHKRQVTAVRKLAADLASQPQQLRGILPQLSQGQQRMALVFGTSLGEMSKQRDFWLEPAISALAGIPSSNRNYDLLSGYVVGLAKVQPHTAETLKKRLALSPDLAPALPVVCWHLGVTALDVSLTIEALRNQLLDPRQLMVWGSGRALQGLSPEAFAPLLDTLFDLNGHSLHVALELMGMYAYSSPEALEGLRPQIRKAAERVCADGASNWGGIEPYHFEQIIGWILKKGRSDQDACAVALTLSRALADDQEQNRERVLEPLVPRLLADFPEISWSLVGHAIVTDELRAWRFEHIFGSSFSFDAEVEPAILNLPEDVLFAWCHAHPDHAPQFAAAVLPVLARQQDTTAPHDLHPTMRRLLDSFGDRQPVLDEVARNIQSFGWTGSFTTYFARFENPLQGLVDHPKVGVRRWAERMLRKIRSEMDRARNEDEELEARREMYG